MSTQKKVLVGIVGTSWWSDAMYLPALVKHPNVQMQAVCGRNPERLKKFATQWEIPETYTDYAEMIDTSELDAVIVATGNDTHHPITMKCAEKGVHILCEKPLALNLAEAREMMSAVEKAGVKHMVPFTYSFMPTAQYLKELIEDGYIGKPYHLNMRYYTGYARGTEYSWRFDFDEAGSGVAGDLATHFLYIAYMLYGEVKAVTAMMGHHVPREPRPDGKPYTQSEDSAHILLEFESGAQGNVHVTAVCYEDTPFGQTHHMEFHGSGGTLYSFTDWDKTQRVSGARQGEGMWKELEIPAHIWNGVRNDTVHNTYKDIFRERDLMTRGFINDILNDTECVPSFVDGLRVQEILEAAVISGREGRRVEIASL